MSYYVQALIADDYNIHRRTAACAASKGIKDPSSWAVSYSWALAGCAGWDEAYSRALVDNVEFPGQHESYITDEMILNAVTELIRAQEKGDQQQQ